jgi:hypothetical protein
MDIPRPTDLKEPTKKDSLAEKMYMFEKLFKENIKTSKGGSFIFADELSNEEILSIKEKAAEKGWYLVFEMKFSDKLEITVSPFSPSAEHT